MVFGRKGKSSSQDKIIPSLPEFNQYDPSPPPPATTGSKILKALKNNILLILTILSVIFGIGLGFLLRATTHIGPKASQYFGYPGELFLRGLKFIILPLISSSLICGISGMGLQKTGKVAIRAVLLYFTTTFSAVIIGLVLVSTIKPGYLNRAPVTQSIGEIDTAKLTTVDTFMDLLRNLIPDNMVAMTFQLYSSSAVAVYKYVNVSVNLSNNSNMTNPLSNASIVNVTTQKVLDYYDSAPGTRSGIDVLGLVVFCITFGAVVSTLGEKGQLMIQFFEIVNEASIKIIRLMMWYF